MNDYRKPFVADIPAELIADLKSRLNATRWEQSLPAANWGRGTDQGYLRNLAEYWAQEFDWSKQAQRLNALPNYQATIDGRKLHYIDAPAAGEDGVPLLLLHGWPSSVFQMIDIIPHLTKAGVSGEAACRVICPTLPGFGLSEPISMAGDDHVQIAMRFLMLMDGLKIERFAIRASDVGAAVGMTIAAMAPQRVTAFHTSGWIPMVAAVPDDLSDAEQAFVADVARWNMMDGAYVHCQATRPDTLSIGLMDSPVGLASWIIEKFHAWTHCDGDLERVIPRDELLANLTLYWATGAIGSSFRFYHAMLSLMAQASAPPPFMATPTAMFNMQVDLVYPPREWVQRSVNLTRWTDAAVGGHFPEWEVPVETAADIRQFLAQLG